jgi:hypothetical protein
MDDIFTHFSDYIKMSMTEESNRIFKYYRDLTSDEKRAKIAVQDHLRDTIEFRHILIDSIIADMACCRDGKKWREKITNLCHRYCGEVMGHIPKNCAINIGCTGCEVRFLLEQ